MVADAHFSKCYSYSKLHTITEYVHKVGKAAAPPCQAAAPPTPSRETTNSAIYPPTVARNHTTGVGEMLGSLSPKEYQGYNNPTEKWMWNIRVAFEKWKQSYTYYSLLLETYFKSSSFRALDYTDYSSWTIDQT